MNRAQRRAGKANPDSRILALEQENQGLRDVVFSILLAHGRIRVPKGITAQIQPGDSMDVRDEGDSWVFTFKPSNMVAADGVKDGKATDAG